MDSYSRTENNATTTTGYTFDGYNRATESVTKSDGTSTNKTYGYDETDWLTLIDDGAKQITYGYDNNGNTTQKTDSSEPSNPITYSYDARDKLIKAGKGATILGQYAYNANGYRIRQQNSDRGDIDYYYDGTAVIEERTGGNLLAHYRYADKLYSLTDGTHNQYYHLDALGSTSDLTDDSGNTKASYFLSPWGLILETLGDSVNRRIFTGKEIDQNTGLVYFGARYYDPDTARFTTQDSYLGEQTTPPSLHRYLYAYSNPTVYIDLEGYLTWEELKSGASDAWSGVKTSTKAAWKALPVVTKKGFAGFDKALDNAYDAAQKNDVPGINNPFVQAGLTAGITGTKAMLGMGSYPLVKASQLSEYTEDPSKIQNIPLYASGLRDTYNASKAFAQDGSLENGAQVVQAGLGTLLEVAGVAYGAKAVGETYGVAGPKSGITVENRSSKDFTELNSLEGTSYEGTIYRYEMPDRIETTWKTHEWNVASDHRYSGPGKGGVYGATSQETAFKEMQHYNALEGRELVSKDVKLDNILDLTNESVRRQLDINLDDITNNSYDLTQKLGDKARENGFKGINAPSARNNGGSNLVVFDGW